MYKGKTFLAIIPARSGSVSVPLKNLCEVGGKSLVSRSILHAQKSKYLDSFVVSTNGAEIKKESEKYGALVINRPEKISGSLSSSEDCLIHSIEYLFQIYSWQFDYVVMLQPTSPFRSDDLIDKCIEQIIETASDSLLTAWEFHDFCFYKVIEDGIWISTYDYSNRPMRQEVPISGIKFFDNGNIYITNTIYLQQHKSRLGGKISVYPISMLESMQIDSLEDLDTCKKITEGGIE